MIRSLFIVAAAAGTQAQALPELVIDRDNVEIDRSVRVVIPEGTVIADDDLNGVIHVVADGVRVEFAPGSVLRGATEGTPWDELAGYGIVLEGVSDVTLTGLKVHGYRSAVWATEADGLVVEQADLSDNWRRRLLSTPEAEDSSDWMSPHYNDNNEWMDRYGAALYIEESDGVTVRNVFVRRGQNGIVFDEVNGSRVYDNDASFLSGWGIALWRSSNNVITRNAFDFCVRGHVEGVYNRGQDSAGILMFEQCSNNIVAENSATHGGDGFFGNGGRESLGQAQTPHEEFDYRRRGCNDNLFVHNDLSYAPAHGWEMTFSFGNKLIANRLVENAICGVWGGFSQDTLIAGNLFDGNGGMPYGLERGGINIEHGAGNVVIDNDFVNNRAGIHYWWDALGGFAQLEWVQANYKSVSDNVIAHNRFVINDDERPFWNFGANEKRLAYHFREDEPGKFDNLLVVENEYQISGPIAERMRKAEGIEIVDEAEVPDWEMPDYPLYGESRPVVIRDGIPYSVRSHLQGRDKIIMDEWGPWDHESPLVRLSRKAGAERTYELLGVEGEVRVTLNGEVVEVNHPEPGVSTTAYEPVGDTGLLAGVTDEGDRTVIRFTTNDSVLPYEVRIEAEGVDETLEGTLVKLNWLGRTFSWADEGDADPRDDFDEWSKLAAWRGSIPFSAEQIDFKFGWGGPKDMVRTGAMVDNTPTADYIENSDIGGDQFGLELLGRVRLEPGTYRVKTISDDGIRVWVHRVGSRERELIIDNWSQHGPTPNEGVFTVPEQSGYEIHAMYFEINGYAMLTLDLEMVDP